ncbi:hypothetical protein SISNIDRAFT_459111 [Sistotremastrum niveocremeum HHB9708]|uniref:Uncharacterized protein n=2 Tax=Sistotremastraceae TaxID=3402574 RepID=A0A164PXS0_9AGAM|nr:hypothetical protein SISNIDRAFT_459111 [Sistotremastrum niveocremeum HHB9708]KZT34043.1 hypothetical protein SISSUDRAFT_1053415 [Sistotremastrum suecicum HHB10207 ss-3]
MPPFKAGKGGSAGSGAAGDGGAFNLTPEQIKALVGNNGVAPGAGPLIDLGEGGEVRGFGVAGDGGQFGANPHHKKKDVRKGRVQIS